MIDDISIKELAGIATALGSIGGFFFFAGKILSKFDALVEVVKKNVEQVTKNKEIVEELSHNVQTYFAEVKYNKKVLEDNVKNVNLHSRKLENHSERIIKLESTYHG